MGLDVSSLLNRYFWVPGHKDRLPSRPGTPLVETSTSTSLRSHHPHPVPPRPPSSLPDSPSIPGLTSGYPVPVPESNVGITFLLGTLVYMGAHLWCPQRSEGHLHFNESAVVRPRWPCIVRPRGPCVVSEGSRDGRPTVPQDEAGREGPDEVRNPEQDERVVPPDLSRLPVRTVPTDRSRPLRYTTESPGWTERSEDTVGSLVSLPVRLRPPVSDQ